MAFLTGVAANLPDEKHVGAVATWPTMVDEAGDIDFERSFARFPTLSTRGCAERGIEGGRFFAVFSRPCHRAATGRLHSALPMRTQTPRHQRLKNKPLDANLAHADTINLSHLESTNQPQ